MTLNPADIWNPDRYYAGVGAHKGVPTAVLTQLQDIAFKLQKLDFVLRSGGAECCDTAFELGVGFYGRKEIYMAGDALPEAHDIARHFIGSGTWEERGQLAQDLLARNVHQVLGRDLRTPSRFVVAWTRNGEPIGGTGLTIRVAWYYGIPVYNVARPGDLDMLKRDMQGFEASFGMANRYQRDRRARLA